MISLIESGNLANTENNPMIPRSAELVGLSTDTKPTGVSVGNGWSFIEMDTGKVFFYNAEDEEWLEFAGSGGGGGSSVSILKVNFASSALDKTAGEIAAAYPLVVISDTTTEGEEYLYTITQISITPSGYELTDSTGVVYAAQNSSDYPEIQS